MSLCELPLVDSGVTAGLVQSVVQEDLDWFLFRWDSGSVSETDSAAGATRPR